MIIPHHMAGKTIAILGLGRTGLASCHALLKAGAQCVVYDDHAPLENIPQGAVARAPDDWDWGALDALITSPGIPTTYPEPHPAIASARQNNVPIMSDIALAMGAGLKAKLIGITGTNGKSTTTSLVVHLLNHLGFDAVAGGNIGTPIMALDDAGADGFIVLELSSYQLDITPNLALDAGALLNITPDHLDRHGGWEGYVASKMRILDGLKDGTTLLIGTDETCQDIAQKFPEKCQQIDPDIAPMTHLPPALQGAHNRINIACAIGLLAQCGVAPDTHNDWHDALKNFAGLPHRMEWLGQKHGIDFINDSKATNGVATAHALRSFPHIYWIAGGRMKADGLGDALHALDHVCRAFLIGESMDGFAVALEGKVPYERSGDLTRATQSAYQAARDADDRAATILLSPAAASFDQFASFEARGEAFRTAIHALMQDEPPQEASHV